MEFDSRTHQKCLCFLNGLVQKGRRDFEATALEDVAKALAFVQLAGDLCRQIQRWAAEPLDPEALALAAQSPEERQLPRTLGGCLEQIESLVEFLSLGASYLSREHVHTQANTIEEGLAIVGQDLEERLGWTHQDGQREPHLVQVLTEQRAEGELELLRARFAGHDLELQDIPVRSVTFLEEKAQLQATCLVDIWNWLQDSNLNHREAPREGAALADLAEEDAGENLDLFAIDNCFVRVRKQVIRAQTTEGDEVFRGIYREIQPLIGSLRACLPDPSEVGSSRPGASSYRSSQATTLGSSLLQPSSQPSGTQVSTAWMQHRAMVPTTILEEEASEVKELVEFHTPFHQAAMEGDLEKVEALLVQAPTDLNMPDGFGDTPLMLAAFNRHETVVRLLCSQAACDIFARNSQGLTARGQALRNGYKVLADILWNEEVSKRRQRQRPPDHVGRAGKTPLEEAIELGHPEDAAALVAEVAAQLQADPDWDEALQIAVRKGQLDVVMIFLDKGANVNRLDNVGRTPLLEDSRTEEGNATGLGADLQKVYEYNQTVLTEASNNGHQAVVELLLKKGADVDKADRRGRTALLTASARGRVAVVNLLLEKGADVNKAQLSGITSLHRASATGHLDVVKLLLEKGADINKVDWLGRTPLLWALRKGHQAVAELLLEQGADLHKAGKDGETPLMKASNEGQLHVVKLLLEKGAHVNEKKFNGRTALLEAIHRRKWEVVRILAAAEGSDLTATDKNGYTPLLLAEKEQFSLAKRRDLAGVHKLREIIDHLEDQGDISQQTRRRRRRDSCVLA